MNIFAHCSSSSHDQTGLIPERIACLKSLSETTMVNGIQIVDHAKVFKADKQGLWFEAGTSRGGTYSCVACSSTTSRYTDNTYSLRCTHRFQ